MARRRRVVVDQRRTMKLCGGGVVPAHREAGRRIFATEVPDDAGDENNQREGHIADENREKRGGGDRPPATRS